MKNHHEPRLSTNLMVNVIWVVLTTVLLFFVFYFFWHKEQLETRQILFRVSDEVSDQVDHFAEDLQQSIYALPIVGVDFKKCTQALLSKLQHTVYNNPYISGLVIKNTKNQLICSTLAHDAHPHPVISEARGLVLYGPIQFTEQDKPAFIVQQRLGDYLIDIYLLQHVLEQTLKTSSPYAKTVALYDTHQNKIILQIERDNQNGNWQSTAPKEYSPQIELTNNKPLMLRTDLNDLENFQIILEADPRQLSQLTWRYGIIAILVVLLLSSLIYYYLRRTVNRFFSLHRAIQNALKNNQFFPVYQPIFDNRRNYYAGVEVLLRWRTNSHEIIMPDTFIEDAEQSGLIVPITLKLIETTFEECQNLLKTNPDFHLSFNVSASHFADDQFFDSFYSLCKKYEISHPQLILEITERDLLNLKDQTLVNRMKELRHLGFSLAVDDFGTGHASISYLQHFPFNYLKIDQLFVRAIGTGAITETLNQSIIHMAINLKLHIIAEGVESVTQVEFLKTHGVTLMQGWYFSKALTIEQLRGVIN